MRRAWALMLVVVAAAGTRARAAEVTDTASAFDSDNPFDFRLRVGWDHTEKRATIERESEGAAGQTQIALGKQLSFAQRRDTLDLRAEFGLWHDLMLSVALPVIIDDSSEFKCDSPARSGCEQSIAGDGIIPKMGYNAGNPSVALADGDFRTVTRGAVGGSGLDAFDTLDLALTWAPVAQHRDKLMPTWTLAFEPHLSIGNVQKFDRAHADANHGVSEGVHRLYFETAVSHRWRYVDPYVSFWYMYPIARGDSLYVDYGPNEKTQSPMQQAGTSFGVELVPLDEPTRGHKLWIDLRGRIEAHFTGRGYSELWELLASSPALACDTAGDHAAFNPACDPSKTSNPYQGAPYTGLTTIQSYATLGAEIAVGAEVARHLRLKADFRYTHDEAHLITGEDIGVPSTDSGRVMSAGEYNPVYRAVIDQVGRRFRVDDVNVYDVGLYAQLQF